MTENVKFDTVLGNLYKDKVSGFIGTCTTKIYNLNGNASSCLTGKLNKDGNVPHYNFNNDSLEVVKTTNKSKSAVKTVVKSSKPAAIKASVKK